MSYNIARAGFDKEIMYGLQAIPNAAPQALSTADTCVLHITVSNTTAAAITLTVTDNQSSPVTLCAALPIPPNTAASALTCIGFESGVVLLDGVIWQAGGAGLTGEIYARAKRSGA